MNEVTKIHLGRQAFTIAVDAHKDLHDYLDAIQDQVKDKDVIEEIESRMAELLTERGITGNKVILTKDVNFLQKQLGDPADFQDDEDAGTTQEKPTETKRLFRDTEHGMLAGVSAGLANYFGVDVLLIRILFVIAVISGGWGILLYIALWLLVPEAKTASDRLQMVGKPVTVSSLKEVAARADVAGSAKRAGSSLAVLINSVFRVLLKIVALGLIAWGLVMLFALIAFESYALVHTGNLFDQNIFPVGFREHVLLNTGVAVSALISILIVAFGLAIFKQKWPIRNWATGTLVGLILVGLAGTIALGADAAPHIRDRYNANLHTVTRTVAPFNSVNIVGGDNVDVQFRKSDTYSVSLRYFGDPNVSTIKTSVSGGILTLDTDHFDSHRDCSGFCIGDLNNVTITISAPIDFQIKGIPTPDGLPYQTRNVQIMQQE